MPDQQHPTTTVSQADKPVRIIYPFKDQKSVDAVLRRQLNDLSRKIGTSHQPVYTSPKIGDRLKDLKVREAKPPLANQQCVIYSDKCHLCDTEYISYTCRHFYQSMGEHKSSAVGKHLKERHNAGTLLFF